MSTIYDRAPKELGTFVGRVMKTHHQDLADAKVSIDVLWAFASEDSEDHIPIKVRGHAVEAKVSITNLQDRVRGIADAKLIIDRKKWDELAEGRREATIDHYLTHLQLVTDKDGILKKDDANRPKLRYRHYDIEWGVFMEVIDRHGEAAPEVRQMMRWQTEYGQLAFFAMPDTQEIQVDGAAEADAPRNDN